MAIFIAAVLAKISGWLWPKIRSQVMRAMMLWASKLDREYLVPAEQIIKDDTTSKSAVAYVGWHSVMFIVNFLSLGTWTFVVVWCLQANGLFYVGLSSLVVWVLIAYRLILRFLFLYSLYDTYIGRPLKAAQVQK